MAASLLMAKLVESGDVYFQLGIKALLGSNAHKDPFQFGNITIE